MHPWHKSAYPSRRAFLTSASGGIGLLALASLLQDDGLRAAAPDTADTQDPQPPHFAPRARACICISLDGATSQVDLFDPKPRLNELDGQPLPASLLQDVRFAFIEKEKTRLMGSPRKFRRHGQCGMELSDFLPHLSTCVDDLALVRSMHTEEFNHHPGELMMNTGAPIFGRPSVGSWLTYGLGSESKDLPAYVVLEAGENDHAGAVNWSSGFLSSTYAGVLFRNQGEPILNLTPPAGFTKQVEAETRVVLRTLNSQRYAHLGDPEIASRVAAYELAFRMQAAAPELIDLASETRKTLAAYGVGRTEPDTKSYRGGGNGTFHQFAVNCLLARRLVERGVRFVSLHHSSWDHHRDLDPELRFNCQVVDQPIAALLKDLKQRGLLESTLVICTSEFGRTPLGENRSDGSPVTGRDHHPSAFSIWLAGGGIKGGQVVGKTDEVGWNVVEDPVHVHDFHATILHLFGLDHLRLTYRFQGRDFRLTDVGGKVVQKLLA